LRWATKSASRTGLRTVFFPVAMLWALNSGLGFTSPVTRSV
jgi:hypothetical protein